MSGIVIILYSLAILISLTFHEVAHGYMAWRRGDDTAKSDGRLSLNPLVHLDIMGTIVFIVTMIYFRLPFGWAKPVPVNPMNLDNPKRDMVYVAAAGPASNMLLALVFGYILIGLQTYNIMIPMILKAFLVILVRVNLGLSFFNLLPIPPLDGSNILRGLLPYDKLNAYIRFTQYAPQIFMGLILLGYVTGRSILGMILTPILEPYIYFWYNIIFAGKIL